MGLKVWLPLNGDLRNQGCSVGNIVNYNATVYDYGKIGKCYSFNGSSYIDVGYGKDMSAKNLSIALWVKPLASINNKIVMGVSNGTNQRFYLGGDSNAWEIGYGKYAWNNTSNAAYTLNTWQHLIVTVDENGLATLYKN